MSVDDLDSTMKTTETLDENQREMKSAVDVGTVVVVVVAAAAAVAVGD